MQAKDIVVQRADLATHPVDVGGRDMILGIGEPALKPQRDGDMPTLDARLNARLPAYMLPALQIAQTQKRRPRLFLVSGVNFALRWNAQTEDERKIMLRNTHLKFDFFQHFIEAFFPQAFSIVEPVISQDILKISEQKMFGLWSLLERKHPEETKTLKAHLQRFAHVNGSEEEQMHKVLGYAVGHLFAMGDINFEGNYVHHPIGYATVGGDREGVFNEVRALLMPLIADFAEVVFEREVIIKDNLRIVVETKEKVPPPYNGFFWASSRGTNRSLEEITYENERDFTFYENHKRLYEDIEYIYSLVSKEQYQEFWNEYRTRYIDLKARYAEAYGIEEKS